MNLTRNQWLAIGGVVLSAMVTSTAYFTDMFGPEVAKQIVGTAGFLNMVINGVAVALSGQSQSVKDVLAMPGVNEIIVNDQANKALATIAVDPAQYKIRPIAGSGTTVDKISKGEVK